MTTIYDLATALKSDPQQIADTQALTLDTSRPSIGLSGAYGLFASDDWWENLKTGIIPTRSYSGVIESVRFEGMHNEGRGFTMKLDEDGTYEYSCVANDKRDLKLHRPGVRLRVTTYLDKMKNGSEMEFVWLIQVPE